MLNDSRQYGTTNSRINTLYTNNYYLDMSKVLKVKVAGQRIKYQVSKVTFAESDLQKANAWRWDDKKNSLFCYENRLDIIRDYETFDCADIGVAVRTNGDIFYEMGNSKGEVVMHNVLSHLYHPILTSIDDANKREGLTLVSVDVYDEENTIYEYIMEISDCDTYDASLLEIITIKDPITDEEYIVELKYGGRKMMGAIDGLSFGEPYNEKSMFMLKVPAEYAVALGLVENRKFDSLLRFEDFIKEDNQKVGKKSVKKVKTAKNYNKAVRDGYVKLREDYIHSFINEHERDYEPEEEG